MRNDLDYYERHATDWWNPESRRFRSLRSVKGYHLGLLRGLDSSSGGPPGLVLDLGCGGGLLSVPLADGARRVVGVDRSGASVRAARDAVPTGRRCRFVRADLLRAPFASRCADLVLLCDVLEHVEDWRAAVREAARLVRRGGHLFVNTINATARARFVAVTLGEGVGLIPRGTHDPRLFVRPRELAEAAETAGLGLVRLQGEAPRLLPTLRSWSIHLRSARSLAVSYNALFRRPETP